MTTTFIGKTLANSAAILVDQFLGAAMIEEDASVSQMMTTAERGAQILYFDEENTERELVYLWYFRSPS